MALREAATVMLVRDGAGGLEVLMVQRNLRSDFVGGAHVFPGGAIDAADREPVLEGLCAGEGDAACSARLGLEKGGLALYVAAMRECFEEAGVLLARRRGDPQALSFSDPEVAIRFAAHRAAVDAGRPLAEVLVEEGLVLDVDRLHYVSHWITPEGAPRRYDTRFFVAEAPPEQEPLHDERETVASTWIQPGEALARHGRGEIDLILPTIRNLEGLARHASVSALVAEAAQVQQVPAIQPRLVSGPDGLRVLLPGDDGYEDPPGDGRSGAPWPARPGSSSEGLR
jgi:8-oxo-dGTP pyrophosphatase MutT (NUDIX family)